MGVHNLLADSMLARYARTIKATPKALIANHRLMLTAAIYATSGIPITWDQGSSSVVPTLPGFQSDFGITSGANPNQIANFISLVYVGAGLGAAASFFVNDRIGRLWSYRLYSFIWILGQLIATGSSGHIAALYAARIVSGFGIGALTVTGPMSIVEVAPTEIRGLMAVWFSVAMLLSLFVAVFCTYGVFLHVAASSLQYQIVFFSPCIFMALMCALTFAPFCLESPRWLYLTGQTQKADETLIALRGLGSNHPRVLSEREDILAQAEKEHAQYGSVARSTSWTGMKATFREAFTVKANLRRVQQALVSYALAQLSGANSVTAYFVPILKLIGAASGDQAQSLFLTGMYSFAKFCFTLIASFFFIDALGRRRSLFTGITLQMISDLYIGVFIKSKQEGHVSTSSSQAAIAMIFIHGFGYAVGLLVLPYVFGAEVWPNQLRSFGSALSQAFHWWFFFGISRATPSILSSMNNWGAFIFFAGWCFVSLIYVYLVVPETAGQSLEEIDELFEGSWFMAWRSAKGSSAKVEVVDGFSPIASNDDAQKSMGHEVKAMKLLA